MRESNKRNKGFSLVEVLVAVSILTIVVASLTKILISSSKVNQKTKRVLSATEISQNLFEGINSKTPEKAILELSALAKSDDIVLDDDLSVIPNGMTYERIAEFIVNGVDPATGNDAWVEDTTGGGLYVQSKVYDASTGKYRCKGFQESANGKYQFAVKGLKQGNTYYDVKITLDASNYDTTYTPASPDPLYATDYVSIPKISNVNGGCDGMSMEGTLALNNVISGEYSGKQISTSLTEAQILKNMRRTYTLDIQDIGVAGSPQIVADLTRHYEYTKTADLALGYSGDYTMGAERIFDSSEYGSSPRNLYLYYTPNYNSTGTSEAALDQFVINNLSDYDINVYIIRMEQDGAEAVVLDNVSTDIREVEYAATVKINESDDTVVNTTIRTNLNDNILKNATLSDYKNRERSINKITYKVNSLSSTDVDARLDVKGLDAQKEKKRVYNVKIDVYMGKSGGKGDHNATTSYVGAFENGFPEGSKLATFTGSIVQ